MLQAVIFDLDGTLLDSVDFHAIAWHDALLKFGHEVSFDKVRSQIGKGGDKLIPFFLSEAEQADHRRELENWRSKHFKQKYLPLVRPFSAVPNLLQRVRTEGMKVAVASSAKNDEIDNYLEIAKIGHLVDEVTSSDDVEESKPAPDLFKVVLQKLRIKGHHAASVGDTPYDAQAARKATIHPIGVLSGGFAERVLQTAGCKEIYPGPASLYCRFNVSFLAKRRP